MADRKQFLGVGEADGELLELLKTAKQREVTEAELHEQRISFAYGNAMSSDEITKDSVRRSSENIRLRA
ncbi:hypothetical protein [uncultured Nisaea sp.]|uniref:hypothetical protein n=1 Tax=uncultured Nisaea sp. TaxID=538215 RepID=UPI0030EB7DF6